MLSDRSLRVDSEGLCSTWRTPYAVDAAQSRRLGGQVTVVTTSTTFVIALEWSPVDTDDTEPRVLFGDGHWKSIADRRDGIGADR